MEEYEAWRVAGPGWENHRHPVGTGGRSLRMEKAVDEDGWENPSLMCLRASQAPSNLKRISLS